MSYLWSFQSYSHDKFCQVFGSGSTGVIEAIIEAVTGHTDFWDVATVRRLARRIVEGGISYTGLSPLEASALDGMMLTIFSPEGLVAELEIEYESPDGVHPTIIAELLKHAKGRVPVTVLPWLATGRRAGASDATMKGEYRLFTPGEVIGLYREVQQIMTLLPRWSKEYVPKVVQECLVGVLGNVSRKGKAIAGLLGCSGPPQSRLQ